MPRTGISQGKEYDFQALLFVLPGTIITKSKTKTSALDSRSWGGGDLKPEGGKSIKIGLFYVDALACLHVYLIHIGA